MITTANKTRTMGMQSRSALINKLDGMIHDCLKPFVSPELPLAILDFRHLWLPDRLVVLLAITGLLLAPLLDEVITMTDRLIGGVVGFAILEIVRRGYRTIRHREGMGAGDPKLFGALGLWLGWEMLPLTLLVASLVGIAAAIAMRGKATAALPFGTYLAVAAFAVAFASRIAGAGAG